MALDPFWDRFTCCIKERIEQNVFDKFAKEHSDKMEALAEFGTVASESLPIPIKCDFDGRTYNVKVRGFVIPPSEARKKYPRFTVRNVSMQELNKQGPLSSKGTYCRILFLQKQKMHKLWDQWLCQE